jgi:ABC-type phosphate/phosphonate transport system substrate-binding protein
VVAARRLPEEVKATVRNILVGLAGEPQARPILERALIERFVPVEDADYHPIRVMLTVAKTANFLVLR